MRDSRLKLFQQLIKHLRMRVPKHILDCNKWLPKRSTLHSNHPNTGDATELWSNLEALVQLQRCSYRLLQLLHCWHPVQHESKGRKECVSVGFIPFFDRKSTSPLSRPQSTHSCRRHHRIREGSSACQYCQLCRARNCQQSISLVCLARLVPTVMRRRGRGQTCFCHWP